MITGKQVRMAGFIHNKKRDISEFVLLSDNEVVRVGDASVQIVSASGHTPGSAMFTIDDTILIGGDTISIRSNNEIGCFSIVQNMNHKKNVELVEKLNNEHFFAKFSIIASGHYGVLVR